MEERWRRDFPIRWDEDNYMTRRELAKFLTLGSGLLVTVNTLIAFIGLTRATPSLPRRPIARTDDIPPGTSILFRYPTDEDPCILVRDREGRIAAYSQVCTHLSCAVVHRADAHTLDCPCHRGSFSAEDGLPIAGPPTRRLPRVLIEHRDGNLIATGIEV